MNRIDMNSAAFWVAANEAGAEEVNIAQIKEILKVFLEHLAKFEDEQVLELIKRYK